MTDEYLRQLVDAVPWWYHRIELRPGLITPGWAPMDADAYGIPDDLSGRTVLDVGAWDGFWSFEALKRGAERVVAIDNFSDQLSDQNPKQRTSAWHTFDLCARALGYSRSNRLQRMTYSVYSADLLGPFDVIFFFGTLYHLRHPLYALDQLMKALKPGGEIYVESAICDDYSPYGKPYGDAPVMEFYPGAEYGNNSSNWWAPTLRCLEFMLQSCNLTDISTWKIAGPDILAHCRGWGKGRKPVSNTELY